MAETKDFLLEVGCEEMPSAPLASAQAQLARLSASALTDAGLAHGAIECHSTPRRLSVLVHDVAMATEEVHEVRRGPATGIAFDAEGRPTKAAQGFARKMGLGAEQLVVRGDGDGKDYVFAETSIPSRPAQPILSAAAKRLIASLEWPNYRSQRWGSEHATFVRPVRWICALLGDEVIPVSFADVTSSNATRGHRVLGAGEHAIANPSAYRETLRSAGVMLEDERREAILAGVARIEEERGGAHVDTPRRVLDEVVNLCEWPTLLVGRFDEEFLAVPHEIICESMLSNQRYFPIYDASGALTREFVVVSNADPAVSPTVVAGNERVVRARLDDAKFFYDEDLKVPLDDFVERLDRVTFQERLGTMRQKVERMESLSAEVARGAGQGDEVARLARRAAHLAKADLVSQAVVEFTNQQGVMGGYYAKAAGEPAEVASAIREHYRDNRLDAGAAVGQVAEQFGQERMLYVLAATVRHFDYDGRISRDNKRWANTIPVCENKDGMGGDRTTQFVVSSHPGLTDLFLTQARREQRLRQPLTSDEIKAEAARLLGKLQEPVQPNSPSGTHFMAEVSRDFMERAGAKDTAALQKLLPFSTLALTTLKDRRGVFALIGKDEDRSQCLRRPSVRSKLQQAAEQKPTAAKKKDLEL